ncbi:unnamed protein product [Angiostrongylus costaricensis]|uniref:Transposase n=1 Tax=Angiostrongylus costaricensis TaxID=334426 RepID=A0A0R3PBM7_ANGCS|nr:unnamed protein product [Angiostrongylus costaricensis]
MTPEKDSFSEHETVEKSAASAFLQREFGYEHRFVRTINKHKPTFAIEEMCINTGFQNLRRPYTDIETMTKK